MATKATAELMERARSSAIRVDFSYDPAFVAAVKSIPGATFVPKDKGGPYWTVPQSMESCYALREAFGKALAIGSELKAWAWREVRRNKELTDLAGADDAELTRLADATPVLAEALHPYQRAGVAFLTHGGICADQPGLGKTLEAIGAVHEADLADGPNLVIAPKTSLDVVWEPELKRWQDEPVYILPEGKSRREKLLAAFREEVVEAGLSGWLVVNPAALRQGYVQKLLHNVEFNAVVWDECHKEGLRDPRSATAKAGQKIKSKLRIGLTGTPMGGKPIQLWGLLHWLRPDVFTSKWAWAREYLEMSDNGFGTDIGDVREDKKEAFNRHLTPYVLRRTKEEVLPELPPKQYVDHWLTMSGTQARLYEEMALDAFARLSESDTITANGVLAEFTRLKQFASAAWEAGEDGRIHPTGESNKLDMIVEMLAERGITGNPETETGGEQVVIFSQFTEIADMLVRELNTRGIETLAITGKVKGDDRKAAQVGFQGEGGPRVLVMNVHAGGVAITLDRADTVVFVDEWWAPDVMEQAEDRVHRASRIHRVTIYYLRTKGTVEEYVMGVVDNKGKLNKEIMDDRRALMGLMLGNKKAL